MALVAIARPVTFLFGDLGRSLDRNLGTIFLWHLNWDLLTALLGHISAGLHGHLDRHLLAGLLGHLVTCLLRHLDRHLLAALPGHLAALFSGNLDWGLGAAWLGHLVTLLVVSVSRADLLIGLSALLLVPGVIHSVAHLLIGGGALG